MTKKMVLAWLDTQCAAALGRVKAAQEEATAKFQAEVYERIQLREIAEAVRDHISQADDLLSAWQVTHRAEIGDPCCGYGSLGYMFQSLLNSRDAVYNNIKTHDVRLPLTPEYTAAMTKYKSQAQKIRDTYCDVIHNVQGLSSAKLAVQYLQELGFDLTELLVADAKPVETALAKSIDVQYLMLEKKEAIDE